MKDRNKNMVGQWEGNTHHPWLFREVGGKTKAEDQVSEEYVSSAVGKHYRRITSGDCWHDTLGDCDTL